MGMLVELIAFTFPPRSFSMWDLIGPIAAMGIIYTQLMKEELQRRNGRYYGRNFIKWREIIPEQTVLVKTHRLVDTIKHLDRPFWLRYSYILTADEEQLQIYFEFVDRLIRPGSPAGHGTMHKHD